MTKQKSNMGELLLTSNQLLSDLLLNHSWNRTPHEYSISKVLLELDAGTFISSITVEEENVYNSDFKQAALKWIESLKGKILGEGIVNVACEIIRQNGYQVLAHNWFALKVQGEQKLIERWTYGTKQPIGGRIDPTINPDNIIKQVHKIGDLVVVESNSGKFSHDNHVFNSLDEAVLRAIAVKYHGNNTQANYFMCKMLEIK